MSVGDYLTKALTAQSLDLPPAAAQVQSHANPLHQGIDLTTAKSLDCRPQQLGSDFLASLGIICVPRQCLSILVTLQKKGGTLPNIEL